MKSYFLAVIFIVVSGFAYAFECPPNQDSTRDDIETLYKNAEHVLFLQISEGKLVENQITYKANVVKALKGKSPRKIELMDKAFVGPRNITIGNYYIIYLYGSREIDFCSPILDLWSHVSDIEKLVQHSKRKDIENAEAIRKTIELSKI